MAGVDKILRMMRESPQNVRFSELSKVCEHYFGSPRQNGTSHRVFKTPWQGDPRINIQEGDGGKAKSYQVGQVLQAIEKLESMKVEVKEPALEGQVAKGGKEKGKKSKRRSKPGDRK